MNWQRKQETRLHITDNLLVCCGAVLWAGIVYGIQTVLCMPRFVVHYNHHVSVRTKHNTLQGVH